tara:strand:+ start:890 stop:1084 length:195 start_codon:yes stop_codon:yes gene_type:complete
MRLQFWHSPTVDEWRWSLYTNTYAPDGKACHQETGTSKDIRKAFDDVANTVEFLVDKKKKEDDS